jgi:hypothetical protein
MAEKERNSGSGSVSGKNDPAEKEYEIRKESGLQTNAEMAESGRN